MPIAETQFEWAHSSNHPLVTLVMSLALLHAAVLCGCNRDHSTLARENQSKSSGLVPGMGSLHHPIDTSSAGAQEFFDQGLTHLYAFNFAEAVKAFSHASQLDPQAAMPYWGTALALGPNYNSSTGDQAGQEAIQKAKNLAATAPENERTYVEALATRFASNLDSDSNGRNRTYALAMANLSRKYPDDPDAVTLYAASLMDLHRGDLWSNDGRPGEDTATIVGTLKDVLRRWPNHVGANHYYVHAMEASAFPERALQSAKRLETLAPSAGHLLHMPAHIYARIGDYAGAIKSTLAAAEIDREYLRNNPSNIPYALGYANHNLLFLIDVASTDGNFELAYKESKELESQARSMLADSSMAEGYLPAPVLVLLRFARWDDLLALSNPGPNLQGLMFYWHYARGCAFANKGQVEGAKAEREEMERVFRRLPVGSAFASARNDWIAIHEIAATTLDARIMAARGDLDAAIRLWRTAVAAEDRMHYHEPPDWYYPVRESLGAALLRNRQLIGAEQVFKKDLVKNPLNPRSLFGLYMTLKQRRDFLGANKYEELLRSVWKGDTRELRIRDF